MRPSNRQNNEIRKIKFTKDYIKHPEGSVLVEFGNTKVICNATLEEKTPSSLFGSNTSLKSTATSATWSALGMA